MPTIANVSVRVVGIDLQAGQLELQVGPFGYTVPIEELRMVATGETFDPRAIIRNVAIAAALGGVDVADMDAMNAMLITKTFKG